jgi:hypothetical protein
MKSSYDFIEDLKVIEQIAISRNYPAIDLYFLGGSGCILGNYLDRLTHDVDIINLDYPSKYGTLFRLFGEYDMLDLQNTSVPPSYRSRCKIIPGFSLVKPFVLSREDIIVSKIIRLAEKDREDIQNLLPYSDITLVNDLINEVLNNPDMLDTALNRFKQKLPEFRRIFNV